MASASFILKTPNSTSDSLIFLIFRYNNFKLKYSTKEKISPKFWNPLKQRAKENRLFPGFGELNTRLQNIENAAYNSFRKLINDNIFPSVKVLKNEIEAICNFCPDAYKNNLLNFADKFIKTSIKKPNTIKHYKQTYRVLEEYSKYIKSALIFEDINLEFYEDFVKYAKTKGFSTNTIGGLIKNTKVFMNDAFERGLTKNIEFKNRKFKTLDEESEAIYLSQEELKKINELDLSLNKRLSKVRDLFIIGCYTGLRFSDLSRLSIEDFTSDRLKVKTEKTGEIVVIPLHPIIKEILNRYQGETLVDISNQKMNQYLKEIGNLAELNSAISINSSKGGEKKLITFKKYELITVHTARRSFATNAFLKNVPAISIMKLTGHRTEKTFMKYIKISQEENANKLMEHPFFN